MKIILAILGGLFAFILFAIGFGALHCYLANQGFLSTNFAQNMAGVLHIGLSALLSGFFVGLLLKDKPWLWSQLVFVLSFVLWFYVWGSIVWWLLILLMSPTLAGGALLGSRLVRSR